MACSTQETKGWIMKYISEWVGIIHGNKAKHSWIWFKEENTGYKWYSLEKYFFFCIYVIDFILYLLTTSMSSYMYKCLYNVILKCTVIRQIAQANYATSVK